MKTLTLTATLAAALLLAACTPEDDPADETRADRARTHATSPSENVQRAFLRGIKRG